MFSTLVRSYSVISIEFQKKKILSKNNAQALYYIFILLNFWLKSLYEFFPSR